MTRRPDLISVVQLDRMVHEPARLALMAALYAIEEADFIFLKRVTEMTSGNLSSHLTRLETAGYVVVTKGFAGRRPQTVCRLTGAGREAFDAWRDTIGALLEPA